MQEFAIITFFIPLVLSIYYNIFPIRGLSVLADKKLEFITNGGWSHNMIDCDFECQSSFFAPNLSWIGENLAKGTGKEWCSKEEVYKQWHNSTPHRKILEEKDVRFEIFKTIQIGEMCYSVLERGR